MRRQQGDAGGDQVRCAIYTRKSTEDGLDSEFNSLDAQREACEAYALSQRHEGWVVLPEQYDDGGFTGANTDRPALQRLLSDIRTGRIGTVLVYKVDRLSRSLLDFAHLIKLFDSHGVSFVSITQHFATNTAIGKLTLNMLLSFAEFERAIIAERVRDKIAGAKRKGMFTGGTPILGYDIHPETHKLVVNTNEASTVESIFEMYIGTGSGQTVAKQLNAAQVTTKCWTTKKGVVRSGREWNGPGVYRILSNRTYLGLTVHKSDCYPGEHEAIVPQELWDKVHSILSTDSRTRRRRQARVQSLLQGIIRCGCCDSSMYSSYTRKGERIYSYYTCVTASKRGYDSCAIGSVAAADIEQAVVAQLRRMLRHPDELVRSYGDSGVRSGVSSSTADVAAILQSIDRSWQEQEPAVLRNITRSLLANVWVHENELDVRIRLDGLRQVVAEYSGVDREKQGEKPISCLRQ